MYGLLAIACLSILLVLVFAGPSRAPGAEQPPTDQNNSTLPIPPKNTTKKPEKILAKPKDFQNGVFRASQKGLAWAKGGQKDGLYLEQKGKEIYLKHVEDDDDVTLLMAAPADVCTPCCNVMMHVIYQSVQAKLQDYQEWTVSKDLKRILLAVDYEKVSHFLPSFPDLLK